MLKTVVSALLPYVVVALMLTIGLPPAPASSVQILDRPRLYVRSLLVMELGVPLLAIAVVTGLSLPPLGATVFLLMAILPGGTVHPGRNQEGDGPALDGRAPSARARLRLLAPLTIPVWIAILNRFAPFTLEITPVEVLRRVAATILVPLIVGFAVRLVVPRIANGLASVLHYFFLAALALAIVAVIYLGAPVFATVALRTLLSLG